MPKSADGLARQRAGRISGGKRMRNAALIGLGEPLPTISLRTKADQLAVLEAVLQAVALGKTSGMVAQTIISLVKAAGEIVRLDQGDQLAALEAKRPEA